MALGSEQLLDVAARSIENGRKVCGRHLDCAFSMMSERERESIEARLGGDIFVDRVAAARRSL